MEERIREIGRALFTAAGQARRGAEVDLRLMEWAMRNEALKVRLFRFVDVLPMLVDADDILAHLVDYLGKPGVSLPLGAWGQHGLELAAGNALTGHALAAVVKAQITGMAHRFIAGADVRETAGVLERLRRQGMAFTLDILGEVTLSDAEADACQRQYLELIDSLTARRWSVLGGETSPPVNISLKLSALQPHLEPADPEGSAMALKLRLRPILDLAKARGAFVNLDMEQYALKDLALKVFRELCLEPAYRDWPHLGIVLQAYLRDSEADARVLLAALAARPAPLTIRLVKGAYWDYETMIARQRNWSIPVYTNKAETDANFERLADLLLAQYPRVRLAVASHNVRSLAAAAANAERRGLPRDALEYQMLYGMGDALKQAVLAQGWPLRVYTPCGQLIPGMAYLVRRLLENTANTSFLRQGFHEKVAPDVLLRNPAESAPSPPRAEVTGFRNTPERNYALTEHCKAMQAALQQVRGRFEQLYPLLIGGKKLITGREIASRNPARPVEIVGRVAAAGAEEAQAAVAAAQAALPAWRHAPVTERTDLLRRTAALLERERDALAALEVYEVGKNWWEADADVCEAIDYLRYYADEIERLTERRLGTAPGETNDYFYEGKGVALVLAPWNFPLAIFTGMTAAALAAGNTVVVKPASQSPIIAAMLCDALKEAGVPDGVFNFLPGPGGGNRRPAGAASGSASHRLHRLFGSRLPHQSAGR